MNNKEKSRAKRFLESPWGIAAIATGAIAIIVGVSLRIRKRDRISASQLKSIGREKVPSKYKIPRFIEGSHDLGNILGNEVGEVVDGVGDILDPVTRVQLETVLALSKETAKSAQAYSLDNISS